MKANERDSRTEQERFIDRMLKEILGGQRNPGDRLPTESELAAQYDLRKTNVHLALKELERLGFLEIVPRHATYVAPYWERANLETLAVIMTHGGTPHPELVDAFLELREMVALGWFCWVGRRPDAAQILCLIGVLVVDRAAPPCQANLRHQSVKIRQHILSNHAQPGRHAVLFTAGTQAAVLFRVDSHHNRLLISDNIINCLSHSVFKGLYNSSVFLFLTNTCGQSDKHFRPIRSISQIFYIHFTFF